MRLLGGARLQWLCWDSFLQLKVSEFCYICQLGRGRHVMENQTEQPSCKSHCQESTEQDIPPGGGGHVGLVRSTGLNALQ